MGHARKAPTARNGRLTSPRLHIDVTEEIIKNSLKRDSSHCMIAEAVKNTVPGVMSVSVDIQTIRFSNPLTRLRYTYLTPRSVQQSLINFDQGELPTPFNFRLQSGAITKMGARKPGTIVTTEDEARALVQPISPPKSAMGKTSRRAIKEFDPELNKRRLVRSEDAGSQAPPMAVIGGKTPPRPKFATRREFGIRAYRS